jgi:ABC-type phosphate/phosphonate transport system substrate-binding protein
MTTTAVRVGAVAAGPSVATIWEGMRAYFEEAGAPIVPVLFASYEEQTEALFNGAIDIAWNGPVAYVRCAARSPDCRVLAMRDVDVNCTTVMIARADSGIAGLADLRGKRLALGDGGSRQGAILPLYYLRQAGLDAELDLTLRSYAAGQTGDLEVLRALHDGAAEAGMIGRPTWDRESAHGRVDPAALRCVWQSAPYNHCNFTALADFDPGIAQRWTDALLKMDYGDPRWRPVMDLEGLTSWQPGRPDGYEELAKAIGFEDQLAGRQPVSDPHRSLGGHAR